MNDDSSARDRLRKDAQRLSKLIAAVAQENKVVLSSSDPTAILFTSLRVGVEDLAEALETAQDEQLTRQAEKLESIAARWQKTSEDLANRTLNAALETSTRVISNATAKQAEGARLAFETAVAPTLRTLRSREAHQRGISALNLFTAAVTLAAALTSLWISITSRPRDSTPRTAFMASSAACELAPSPIPARRPAEDTEGFARRVPSSEPAQ